MASLRVRTSFPVAFLGLALLLLNSFFAAPPARAQYTAPIDIPPVGGSGYNNPTAISKNGIVTGYSYTGDNSTEYGFIWKSGVLTGIGSPGQYVALLCPIICTSAIVSVAQLSLSSDSRRLGCGEAG